jgi:cytochrome b
MSDAMTNTRPDTRLVWDLPVRVTHWALALAVAGSFATHYAGIEWFAWHRRCGYVVLVLTVFRVLWGIVGTRHARFANFMRGPMAVLQYVRGRAARPAGHNPLGALSVLALLALLLLQAGSGLFANDEIMSMGPFYGWIAPELSNRITSLHRNSSDVLLVLVALHVVAIAWYARVRGERLVRPMVTGRKPAAELPAGEAITHSRTLLAVAIVATLACALALAVRAAPEATIALY